MSRLFGVKLPRVPVELMATPRLSDLHIQRKAHGGAAPGADASAIAANATRGPGSVLPHQARIQTSFGRHDVSNIRAFHGSDMHGAMRALGARAFAYGDAVAFADAPDLHTAAHEAAHVIQQRGGVRLPDNLDQPGDVYERHADAVADRVVAGQSAEALLDQMAGSSGASHAVQRKPDDKAPSKDDAPRLPDGQKPDGSFIIIRGEPGAVNWSGFGGVRPIAHSHPLTPQKLLAGSVTFADLIKGGAKMELNKVNVFPSAADVQFCVAHGLAEHTVQTPYVSKGGGLIGNPAPGAREPLISIKIKQPERVGSWGGNEQLGVYQSEMVAVDGKGTELWRGEVWTADHPGLGSVVLFDEPPSSLMTKKVAGAITGIPHSTKTSDPVKARWVSELPAQLSLDEQHRLDLMSKGKSAGEVYDMFGGDLAIARAKLGGSNLTPVLYAKRARLTDEARRGFDNKWNQMIGGDRAPSDAKLSKFEGYLDAIEKRAGGDLSKGLEAEARKIPPGVVVAEPKAASFPASWSNFEPARNVEFKAKLEAFRGTDFMEQNYAGGEGAVYLGESKTTALKRWFAKRIGDMATSIAKLRSARAAVAGDPNLATHIDVVAIHETGGDWIVRDFVTGSEELKHFA